MSELKAYRPRELVMQGRHNEPIYLKSEADKVIARHKYKRCMAMAKWCENALFGWMGHKESYSSHQRYTKVMLYTRWHKRWLKIAERFKEAK